MRTFANVSMIVFPNCKINIGLEVLRKREDGYHDLSTIFYPIHRFHDSLELHQSDQFQLSAHGIDLQVNLEDNIVFKAYQLLQNDFDLAPVQIDLIKYVPHGAGLGGGSSDAAFTLKLLDRYFELGLSHTQLLNYALQLGSDCPFFIVNQAAYASARGEHLLPIELNLLGMYIVLVKPAVYISTAVAFSGVKPRLQNSELLSHINLPIADWRSVIVNDFETSVFEQYPHLNRIKKSLYDAGASFAAMSGSGSTIYGLFADAESAQTFTSELGQVYVFEL